MKSLFVVYAVLFGAFIGISLPLPLMGPLFLSAASPFAITDHQRYLYLSLALAAFPLGNLFGAPMMGFISDRLGRKRVLLCGLTGGALFYLLSGLAIAQGSFLLLLASRFWCGLCEGNSAIAQSYIANSTSAEAKPRQFGIMIAVISVGYVAGPLVGGLLTNASLFSFASNALPFYFVGGIISLTVLFVAYFFANDNSANQPTKNSLVDGLKELFQKKMFVRLIMLALLLAMGRSLFIDFFASFLNLRFSMASEETTWLWVLLAAVWGVSALFCDFASRIISYHTKMFMACGLAGTLAIFISFSQSIVSLIILSSLMVVGLALAGTINAVLVSDAAPKSHMGLAMGLLSSTYLGGEVTACFGGGNLLSISEKTPFLVSGGLLWTVSIGFFILIASRKSSDKTVSAILR